METLRGANVSLTESNTDSSKKIVIYSFLYDSAAKYNGYTRQNRNTS